MQFWNFPGIANHRAHRRLESDRMAEAHNGPFQKLQISEDTVSTIKDERHPIS